MSVWRKKTVYEALKLAPFSNTQKSLVLRNKKHFEKKIIKKIIDPCSDNTCKPNKPDWGKEYVHIQAIILGVKNSLNDLIRCIKIQMINLMVKISQNNSKQLKLLSYWKRATNTRLPVTPPQVICEHKTTLSFMENAVNMILPVAHFYHSIPKVQLISRRLWIMKQLPGLVDWISTQWNV